MLDEGFCDDLLASCISLLFIYLHVCVYVQACMHIIWVIFVFLVSFLVKTPRWINEIRTMNKESDLCCENGGFMS